MTDLVQVEYNKFSILPNISYNIVSYLIDNNETIFKLLKYSSSDAWNKSNLTKNEKIALIYNGSSNMTDFRLFLDNSIDDSWLVEACQLRVSPLELSPNNFVWGSITIGFEIYAHSKVNTLSNYTTRVDTMVYELINTLNGADIEGIGRLVFDSRASNRCRVSVIGSLPYKGKAIMMITRSLG